MGVSIMFHPVIASLAFLIFLAPEVTRTENTNKNDNTIDGDVAKTSEEEVEDNCDHKCSDLYFDCYEKENTTVCVKQETGKQTKEKRKHGDYMDHMEWNTDFNANKDTIADCIDEQTAYYGNDVVMGYDNKHASLSGCIKSCQEEGRCKFWSYHDATGYCFLKSQKDNIKKWRGYTSGSRDCGLGPGFESGFSLDLLDQFTAQDQGPVMSGGHSCNCGIRASGVREISGGKFARKKRWPWVVRLVGGCGGVSGGALVSPSVVLTAHHCTTKPNSKKSCNMRKGKPKIAILGGTYINYNKLKRYQYRKVIEARSPDNAHLTLNNYDSHDFALLILEKPAKYTDRVRTICLPHPNAEYGNKWATAAGWGRTDLPSVSEKQSPKLKVVDLKVNPARYDRKYMFGTFLKKEKGKYEDPCAGDSGGPLMYLNSKTKRYELIGTVNGQGFNCKTGGIMEFEGRTDGIWNKVSAHVVWIEEQIKSLGEIICR